MNLHIRYVHWIAARLPNCEIWRFCRQHLATLATPTITSIKCKQSPVYGVFYRYFHIPLPIVTKHELGLPFPPRNLPIKFNTNPSTIFLVIVVTDTHRQTDKPTPLVCLSVCVCVCDHDNLIYCGRICIKTYSLAFAGRIIVKFDLLSCSRITIVRQNLFLFFFKFQQR